MFDIVHYLIESVKKINKEIVAYFILQQFIRNSTSWFNFKNLVWLFSICYKRFLTFLKYLGVRTVSIINQSYLVVKETAQLFTLSLFVLTFMILLKLHSAGIIKLSSDKVLAISVVVLAVALISTMSKMEFTKIEATEEDTA